MEFPSSCLRLVLIMIVVLDFVCRSKAAISEVIAFGDSILDTGNNNFLLTGSKCNVPPYGMSLPLRIPTGRFGNGRVFSDILSEKLGHNDMLPAFLSPRLTNANLANGVVFASGGSGLDDRTARVQNVITLGTQLENFKKYLARLNAAYGEAKAKAIIANALFLISAGNNDLGISYGLRVRPLATIRLYTATLVPIAQNFVKQLYALGARKIAYMGVLPLGCLPGNIMFAGPRACNELFNNRAQYFNTELQKGLAAVRETLPGADVFYIDVYTPLYNVIKNAASYGFTSPLMVPCVKGLVPCANVQTHVFWDFAHPTEKAYRLMMQSIVPAYAAHFQ